MNSNSGGDKTQNIMIKVLNENKALFDRLGITKWHESGYDGSLGISITFERPFVYPIMRGLIENLWTDVQPVGERPYDQEQYHAYCTTMVHLEVAQAENSNLLSLVSE